MTDEYVMRYQPYSVFSHAHWPVLRTFYLETCKEPLHRMHLQASFRLPSLDPRMIVRAIILMGNAYDMWREKYGLEDVLAPLIEAYVAECTKTVDDEA